MNDDLDIDRFRRGDARVVANYRRITTHFLARQFGREPDTLDELVQATLLECLTSYDRGMRPANAESVHRWIWNRARTVSRRHLTRRQPELVPFDACTTGHRSAEQSRWMRARERLATLADLAEELSPTAWKILLAVGQGSRSPEIASELGVSEGYVRTVLQRAREQLSRGERRREVLAVLRRLKGERVDHEGAGPASGSSR